MTKAEMIQAEYARRNAGLEENNNLQENFERIEDMLEGTWTLVIMNEDDWLLKVHKDGHIVFNVEKYPNLTAEDFAKKFVEKVQDMTKASL